MSGTAVGPRGRLGRDQARRLLGRPLAREVLLLTAAGVFMACVGAFNTRDPAVVRPAVYWITLMVAGGLFGVGLERLLAARVEDRALRAMLVTVLMTVPVMVLVWIVSRAVWGSPLTWTRLLALGPSVLLVCSVLNAVRYGVRPDGDAQAPAGGGAPDGSAFRQRLPARLRAARIYAVEAHDHYLRVHTAAGTELILMRFGDALAELGGMGLQTHRSWWVAKDAIEGVDWRRGRGELRLAGGVVTPVSRSFAPRLREQGWF